jgi:hypothetical protein
VDLKEARYKFNAQARQAKARGIPFLFTFEEWCYIWEQSGKWELRGSKKGEYCMSRKGDTGPYAIDNVFIQLHSNNVSESRLGVKLVFSAEHKANMSKGQLGNKNCLGNIVSDTTRANISKAKLGVPQFNNRKPKPILTCPHCNNQGGAPQMKRWHFNNCKRKAA